MDGESCGLGILAALEGGPDVGQTHNRNQIPPMNNHAFPFHSPSALLGLARSASLAAALASGAVAQVLEAPTWDESYQVVRLVADAIAVFHPNPVCVSMVFYDATFVPGPMLATLADAPFTLSYAFIPNYVLPSVRSPLRAA